MTLSFRTDRFGQTVQTQIRLLLEKQSDQGLHCFLHCLLFHTLRFGLFVSILDYSKVFWRPKILELYGTGDSAIKKPILTKQSVRIFAKKLQFSVGLLKE